MSYLNKIKETNKEKEENFIKIKMQVHEFIDGKWCQTKPRLGLFIG